MGTMKTLMLSVITALSLGMGAAMAQEGGSDYPVAPDYWAPSSIAARQAQAAEVGQAAARNAEHLQAGSSDGSGPNQAIPSNSNGTTVPNPD
jgi:hypothetical protein